MAIAKFIYWINFKAFFLRYVRIKHVSSHLDTRSYKKYMY